MSLQVAGGHHRLSHAFKIRSRRATAVGRPTGHSSRVVNDTIIFVADTSVEAVAGGPPSSFPSFVFSVPSHYDAECIVAFGWLRPFDTRAMKGKGTRKSRLDIHVTSMTFALERQKKDGVDDETEMMRGALRTVKISCSTPFCCLAENEKKGLGETQLGQHPSARRGRP